MREYCSNVQQAEVKVSIPTGTIESRSAVQQQRQFRVSIPTGTIEREPRQTQIFAPTVSIPTGTIESLVVCVLDADHREFQFQQVRLRANCPVHEGFQNEFQFQQVRLRGRLAKKRQYRVQFQFQQVRLRGVRKVMLLTASLGFNSNRYD